MRIERLEGTLLILIFGLNIFLFVWLLNPVILGKVISEKNLQNSYSPSDFLTEKDIIVESNRVIIQVSNSSISRYNSSGSMIPFLSETSNGIVIVPESPEDLKVGDIITFEKQGGLIVHRIVEKGEDSKGVYFITQGDNVKVSDDKVRFDQIRSVIVAVIY